MRYAFILRSSTGPGSASGALRKRRSLVLGANWAPSINGTAINGIPNGELFLPERRSRPRRLPQFAGLVGLHGAPQPFRSFGAAASDLERRPVDQLASRPALAIDSQGIAAHPLTFRGL
jgi:hypothetical protein